MRAVLQLVKGLPRVHDFELTLEFVYLVEQVVGRTETSDLRIETLRWFLRYT